MIEMEHQDINTFRFECTEPDGTITVKEFQACAWPKVIDQLVPFLNGCGYHVEPYRIILDDVVDTEKTTGELLSYVHCEPGEFCEKMKGVI